MKNYLESGEKAIGKKKRYKRPTKKKFTVPYDVALLILVGALLFSLIAMMNWTCKIKEKNNELNMSLKVQYNSQYLRKGIM
ncbi:MAG: hypothetical protein KAU06_08755 [Candidatus Marinimicrobia bacterium]|nr:hypothetical protein [Candidatus Neomarinimicrobiota bacterium]